MKTSGDWGGWVNSGKIGAKSSKTSAFLFQGFILLYYREGSHSTVKLRRGRYACVYM